LASAPDPYIKTSEYLHKTLDRLETAGGLEKLEGGKPDTYTAQMLTYHELLWEVGDRAREIYSTEELYDVVETFTLAVTLDTVSPRVWKMQITWRDPAWGVDEIVSMRLESNPGLSWTEEEREILRMQYGISTRRELLEMLPTRSWAGIRTIASDMKLRRQRDDSENEFPYDICLADWQAIRQYGLSIPVGSNNRMARSPQETDSNGSHCVISKLYRSWK